MTHFFVLWRSCAFELNHALYFTFKHSILLPRTHLLLELPGSEVLQIGPLLIVEYEEKAVAPELFEDGRIIEDLGRLGGEGGRGVIGVGNLDGARSLVVGCRRDVFEGVEERGEVLLGSRRRENRC